jgi:membrane protease YdiL (CAAX protease family)
MYICAMLFIFTIITLPLYTYHIYDSHAIATIPLIINILLIATLVTIVKTFQIYSKNPTFFKFTIMHISVNIIMIILLAAYLYPNIKFIK